MNSHIDLRITFKEDHKVTNQSKSLLEKYNCNEIHLNIDVIQSDYVKKHG